MTALKPELFDPTNIDPETAKFNARLEKLLNAMPPTYTLSPQKIRADREAGKGLFLSRRLDEVATRHVPGPQGEVGVRVYVPEAAKGVYLHFHGGGFMLGRAHDHDEENARLAKCCQVAVVSVDYRLAPENPHPAGADDGEAVAAWLAAHARQEFGSDTLMVGGESAGANLSVVTLLRMRDKHDFKGFAGANLLYGVYSIRPTPSAANWGEQPNYILTTKLMKWFHSHYTTVDKYDDPDVSPLLAQLGAMPPALFTVGTLDPLLDDTLFMHARWMAAGNPSELAVYPGGTHAFNGFPIAIAKQANECIHDFIRRVAHG